jgi:hypothetical protein
MDANTRNVAWNVKFLELNREKISNTSEIRDGNV